jgi:carbonic anhydrase/acetyltransferase-like protein (isoleucine patch superfamily)
MAHIIPFGGKRPRIHPSAFIAPTAVLIGDVEVGEESSIWFGAVLRGDHPDHGIRIGRRTSIQDNVVVHVSAEGPTLIGDDVTVGHGAAFESCEIRRGALIGMNAVLLHHAIIGEESLVAALSVVAAGTEVPPRALVAGAPATVRKSLEGSSADWIRGGGSHYVELSRQYLEQGLGHDG